MRTIPPVTLDQVLGLVKYIASAGGVVDSSRLDEMLDVDMNLLPHVVDAAVQLGLLRTDDGNLIITDAGRRILSAYGKDLRLLIRSLCDDVMPFKKIFDAIGDDDKISRSALEALLREAGYSNIDSVLAIFTEWLAYMGVSVTS